MPETPPPRPRVSIPCTACGYDLAGLALPGKCPECGARGPSMVLAKSARPPAPRWLRTAATVWFASVAFALLAAWMVSVQDRRASNLIEGLWVVVAFTGYALMLVALLCRRWRVLFGVLLMIALIVFSFGWLDEFAAS